MKRQEVDEIDALEDDSFLEDEEELEDCCEHGVPYGEDCSDCRDFEDARDAAGDSDE